MRTAKQQRKYEKALRFKKKNPTYFRDYERRKHGCIPLEEAIPIRTARLVAWTASAPPESLAKMRERQRETQLSKGPKHEVALFWSLISPNGVIYKFHNLAHFIRENSILFSNEQLNPVNRNGRTRAEAALSKLSPRRKHCREIALGWRWFIDAHDQV